MNNGPQLNELTQTFTTRDSLGVEGVAASMAAAICPIINTVTPRPFYWAFLCWIYYDFYMNEPNIKRDYQSFDRYFLKKQDYFFVLSQLLADNPDRERMAGVEKASTNKNNNTSGFYEFDSSYFKSRFGGMQYYNSGLFTMGLVNFKHSQSFPNLTGYGEKLAKDFERIIKDTEYYSKYRLSDKSIPKNVLIEYGNKINIGLKGFDDCKVMLREHLLEKHEGNQRNESWDYALFLHNDYNIVLSDYSFARETLYNKFSPRGGNETYPVELGNIIKKWEMVIARQYFAASLEIMWKYMLSILNSPKTKEKWIEDGLNDSIFDFELNDCLETIIENDYYDYKSFEEIIKKSYGNKIKGVENNLCYGIRMLISLYNRLSDREDYNKDDEMFLKMGDYVSLYSLIDLFNKSKKKKIGDILAYIIDKWIIVHHYETAIVKMVAGRDGFYYKLVDGYYFKNEEYEYSFDMPGIRFLQLTKAMIDLDIIKVSD